MHKINKPKLGGFKRSLKYQSQKRAMPKNVQTTPQLDSFHMLARFQLYMNREILDIQAGFRKGRGTRDQIVNICLIIEKAKEFQKNIDFCFIDYAKAFGCVDHNKMWKTKRQEYQIILPISWEICM